MTTGDLVETVITYPFMADILCYDSYEVGLKHVCECLQEYLYDQDEYNISDDGTESVEFHWKYNLDDIDVSEEIIVDTLSYQKSS